MSNQLLRLFGSYDLFGKSVPGAALLFGVWLLLPESAFPISFGTPGNSLVNIAALLLLLLLLGLMIGQGLHTVADNIEKVFRWLLFRTIDLQDLIAYRYGVSISLERFESPDEREESTFMRSFFDERRDETIEWIRRRFWGTFDSFAGHRYLFSKWFEWNYTPSEQRGYDNRWEEGERDAIMEPFAEAFESVFGEDIRQFDREEIEQVYPLITAYLANKNLRGHRQFQSIYSFCRSLWVVLFALSIAYAIVIYQPLGALEVVDWNPRIQTLPPDPLIPVLPLLTFLATIVFVDASGTYKYHFIEYLLATFAKAEDSTEPQQSQQTSLDEF